MDFYKDEKVDDMVGSKVKWMFRVVYICLNFFVKYFDVD